MKKLSEFKDEQGAVVVAKLLPPIFEIIQNAANKESKNKSPIDFVSDILANTPSATMKIFAILSEVEPEEYHTDAIEIMKNVITLATDDELMSLFGLQRQTKTSSGSASESTAGKQE